MHHLTDLIWLILMLGIFALATRAGGRTRLAMQSGQIAQRHPCMVLAVIGVIYTAIVLQWSARNGRLAMDPQWDDVGYLLDAQQRLTIFDWQGLLKVIESFWKSPPHSPWSSACALLGFVIFGLHAWAPYIINVVLVLGMLLSCYTLLPALPVGERLVLSALPLLLPISARLVQEFRPDPAVAVATVAFCLGTLKLSFFSPAVAGRWQTHFRFGLLAGLALLIKPSFLYHTVVIMALTQACSAAAICLRARQPAAGPKRAACITAFFGGTLLVAGWYYVRALPVTLQYIHQNTANNENVEIHRLHADTFGVLKNFLVNGEMARMLGPFLPIFAAVVVLGLVYFFLRRRWPDAGYVASILACATASVTIFAYARLDNPYFGIFWELALVMAALHVIGVAHGSGPMGRRISGGFIVLAIGTFLVHSPFSQFYYPSLDGLASQSLNRAVVLKIAGAWSEAAGSEQRAPKVQVCFGGPVNHHAQEWVARELRYPFEFGNSIEERTVEAAMNDVAGADFVEVADPASKWLYHWLPSGSLQGELLERLRANPAFAELPTAVGREGNVYIFFRKPLARKNHAPR